MTLYPSTLSLHLFPCRDSALAITILPSLPVKRHSAHLLQQARLSWSILTRFTEIFPQPEILHGEDFSCPIMERLVVGGDGANQVVHQHIIHGVDHGIDSRPVSIYMLTLDLIYETIHFHTCIAWHSSNSQTWIQSLTHKPISQLDMSTALISNMTRQPSHKLALNSAENG